MTVSNQNKQLNDDGQRNNNNNNKRQDDKLENKADTT